MSQLSKGMKTAVSIPDEIFQSAERLARRTRKSRSQLFSDAVREYVARHAPEDITDKRVVIPKARCGGLICLLPWDRRLDSGDPLLSFMAKL